MTDERQAILEIHRRLSAPFPAKDIQWRIGRSGKNARGFWATALAYVDSRAIMDRLDEVLGTFAWEDNYIFKENGVVCELSVTVGNRKVTKVDGAQFTQVEAFKGGISDALKRAAVKWGIGRYLYDLEETFVECSDKQVDKSWNYAKSKEGVFYWKTPELPGWATVKAGNNTQSEAPKKPFEPSSAPANTLAKAELLEAIKSTIMSVAKGKDGLVKLTQIKEHLKVEKSDELDKWKKADLDKAYKYLMAEF